MDEEPLPIKGHMPYLVVGERCPKCGTDNSVCFEFTPKMVHYGRVHCSDCGYGKGNWVRKPENITARKRSAASKSIVKRFSQGYCEMCLRTEEQLPNNQVLEGHHILGDELGKHEREDVWIICTACHRLVGFVRTYFGHYHKED